MANYLLFVPVLKKYEGGLSKAKTDTASKNPVPDGSGYHTNKGITWSTFKAMAQTIDYTATPTLFYQMPENIWLAILKKGYWDKVSGDKITSQAIAEMVTDAIWAGAYNAIYAVKNIQSVLNDNGYNLKIDGLLGTNTANAINNFISKDKRNEKKLLDAAYNGRLEHFQKIGGVNLRGWTNRLNNLYDRAKGYLGQIAQSVTNAGSIVKKKIIGLLLLELR
jgi:lysozyme family protein